MTKDEIETEVTRRFSEVTYPGMPNSDYLRVLAATVISFVAEQTAEKPCEYEARELPIQMVPTVARSGQSGLWCRTHGWDCPKANSVVNK